MNNIIKIGLVSALLSSTAAVAQTMTEDDVKRLALQAILENPEIVMQAVAILQAEEDVAAAENAARVLTDQRMALEQDPNAPVLGNPDGDVTLVEFFDYNCPYCKRAAPEIEALISADSNVRVVYREWPILSEGSVFAAKAALAAREQGKYEEFHWALMDMRERAEESSVIDVAESLGLDVAQLRLDMESATVLEHIQNSMDLARQLGFSGTPSFVIGEELVPGFVPLDELQRLVVEARATED